MAAPRPYETLLAKGEDRRQRILGVAERLLARNGWRNTSLAQIAKEAGVTPAGLLHHFESKEQLLNAVLDARDEDDAIHADYESGDLITELSRVPARFDRAPELVGTFTVLLVENIAPDAPLHDRLHKRYRAAIDILTEIIERGQRLGKYRPDCRCGHQGRRNSRLHQRNGDLMAARPVNTAHRGVQGIRGVAGRRSGVTELDMRYRLDVVAANAADAVKFAGGWMYDRVMAGWDVTVLLADRSDERPLQILGVATSDLESALALWAERPHPQTVAVAADLFASDDRVRRGVLGALEQGLTEVTLWGDSLPAELDDSVGPVAHRLSAAARAFKSQALTAAADAGAVSGTETFRCGVMATPSVAADLIPAS